MRRMLIAAIFATAAGYAAYAEDQAKQPDPNAAHPPESSMDQATPTMKAPDGQPKHSPTEQMGEAVPPMKATDPATESAEPSTQTLGGASANLKVTEEQANKWIDRSVYSSDGKNLGEVADLKRDPENRITELHVDIGGFLGLGETRVRVAPEQIQEVKDDRIILTIKEADAENLPPANDEAPSQTE